MCVCLCKCVCVHVEEQRVKKENPHKTELVHRWSECNSCPACRRTFFFFLSSFSFFELASRHLFLPSRMKQGGKKRSLIKRRIIATVPLGFQQGRQCKHNPPFFPQWAQNIASTNRRTRGQKKSRWQKTNKTQQVTLAVVVVICGFRGKKSTDKIKKHWQLPFRSISWGQGAIRAVWILSAMKARGVAGCAASMFIQPLAPEGVASRLSRRAEREVQWASSTLARRKNKGRHYASCHIYSLTHTRARTSTHTLYTL